jgi:PPOX class probable F420-dependent enzyme
LTTQLSGQRYINLETYRRDGEAVRTTVFVVVDGGLVYVRTNPRTGKVKRILDNPRVRLAPSDGRGSPRGDWMNGEAHMLEGEEAARILLLFKKKYGLLARILDPMNRLRGMGVTAVISIKV